MRCQRLKARIEEVSEKVGVSVDLEVHEGIKEIMLTENDNILQSLPPNSFQVSTYMYVHENNTYNFDVFCSTSIGVILEATAQSSF